MVRFIYGDCVMMGAGERQSCSPPLEVQVRASCFVKPSDVAPGARLQDGVERGGAQSVRFRDGHIEIWSGLSHITIHADGQPELATRAINALRGLNGLARGIDPATPLAPPDWSACP